MRASPAGEPDIEAIKAVSVKVLGLLKSAEIPGGLLQVLNEFGGVLRKARLGLPTRIISACCVLPARLGDETKGYIQDYIAA